MYCIIQIMIGMIYLKIINLKTIAGLFEVDGLIYMHLRLIWRKVLWQATSSRLEFLLGCKLLPCSRLKFLFGSSYDSLT